MAAALHGSAEMVGALLDAGADPRAASEAGVTALLWGAWDANKVRLLLERGADPNARSALGNTPLMVAAGSPTGSADSINRQRFFWGYDTPEKYATNLRAYYRMISGI